jgi:uncharacterized protein YjeT (DUF2065 family)
MSEQQGMTAPRAKGLLVAGIGMLVLGGLGAFLTKTQAERRAALLNEQPDFTLMWVLIVVAALGVIALIVRAATAPNRTE